MEVGVIPTLVFLFFNDNCIILWIGFPHNIMFYCQIIFVELCHAFALTMFGLFSHDQLETGVQAIKGF